MYHLLSRILMFPIYLILTNLKTLSIHSLLILNVHGRRIPSLLILLDIWRAGRVRNAIEPWELVGHQENMKTFRKTVKITKRSFFNLKIQEISNKKWGPWELISWVNKHKLPAIEAIKYNDQLCLTIDNLWNTLHSTFNTAFHQQVDINILNEIVDKSSSAWALFSKKEFRNAITNYNNFFIPGPDKLLWSHLKIILKDGNCLSNIISIANTCINLGYWLSHFKRSMIVIISKSNKQLYDSPKLFRLIVLLNTVSKLIKKVISERLQFTTASNNFIHLSQLGDLKFKSTTDASIALMHIIQTG